MERARVEGDRQQWYGDTVALAPPLEYMILVLEKSEEQPKLNALILAGWRVHSILQQGEKWDTYQHASYIQEPILLLERANG